jgi:hypothetical protein
MPHVLPLHWGHVSFCTERAEPEEQIWTLPQSGDNHVTHNQPVNLTRMSFPPRWQELDRRRGTQLHHHHGCATKSRRCNVAHCHDSVLRVLLVRLIRIEATSAEEVRGHQLDKFGLRESFRIAVVIAEIDQATDDSVRDALGQAS